MKLLAVETATEACSAALAIDGVITHRFALAPREHTQLILPMIDELIAEAGLRPQDLDVLAFGCGPGSFTGVRIATGVIQGLAFGLDIPVVPVSTLAAMAQAFFEANPQEETAYVGLDARMDEIFWGVYQRDAEGFAVLLGEEAVLPASMVESINKIGAGIGSAWAVYGDVLLARLSGWVNRYESNHLPTARAIAELGVRGVDLGLAVPVEQAMPVYLRNKVAKKTAER
ncbi:MAG: tRNA (adenosine(37)-N6)-threonylcarbamoyltransferase complex dimerization subunit type 1 TsaB [Methylococcaceae bacterium]